MPADVERFGRIAQKLAEIMRYEQVFLASNRKREMAMRNLVDNVAAYNSSDIMDELISIQGIELGISLTRCKCAMVVEMTTWPENTGEACYQTMARELRGIFTS